MEKKVEEKIQELQSLEQNMQQLLLQKQNFQAQLLEIENALHELEKNPKQTFKIIGPIMVETSKTRVEKDLNEKKEILDIKMKNVNKQEEKIREKVQTIQAEVLKEMQKK